MITVEHEDYVEMFKLYNKWRITFVPVFFPYTPQKSIYMEKHEAYIPYGVTTKAKTLVPTNIGQVKNQKGRICKYRNITNMFLFWNI